MKLRDGLFGPTLAVERLSGKDVYRGRIGVLPLQLAEFFERELLIDPGNTEALTYLGDIAMKREDPEKALTFLRKATRLGSDNRLAYLDIAAILVDQKQYPEALSTLRQAEKLDPNQSDVHFRLGRLYQIMGDNEAAEKEFRRVRELKEKEDLTPKGTKNPSP